MIKRLTQEEADKILAARQAKARLGRAERMKRLQAEALRMMQGRQGQDYVYRTNPRSGNSPRKSSRPTWTTVKRLRSQNYGKCCNSLPSTHDHRERASRPVMIPACRFFSAVTPHRQARRARP